MRVLVCGGRNYSDANKVRDELDRLLVRHGSIVVIEGGASGADRLARLWAIDHGQLYETYEANWSEYGPSAGPLRNERMIAEGKPDLVLAFPGGKGTANMIRQANGAELSIRKAETGLETRHENRP